MEGGNDDLSVELRGTMTDYLYANSPLSAMSFRSSSPFFGERRRSRGRASSDGLDVEPVRPGGDVDLQRDVQVERGRHRVAHQGGEGGDLVVGGLEDQLVVDLEEHPGLEALRRGCGGRRRAWPA